MTPPDLPDDPRGWPADPFALLGVPRGTSDTDIKRAYTRLIRRFKPEQFPEQFRRIREAYEACLAQAPWFRHTQEDDPEESEPLPWPAGTSTPPEADTGDDRTAGAAAPRPPDEGERLWAVAVEGHEEEAYTGLVILADTEPMRPDLPLRLYWLLAVRPDLDPERTRHDWLAEALTRSRLTGPAAELYRRELEADPGAALYGPYAELLMLPTTTADRLNVARMRLAAAGRTDRRFHAIADLQTLRAGALDFDDTTWLYLLSSAIDWTAWGMPDDTDDFLRNELAQLRHLSVREPTAFDRIEETGYVAEAGRAARKARVPEELVNAVRAMWAGRWDVPPDDIGPAIRAVAENPWHYLDRLDGLIAHHGPGFAVLLARFLSYHRERLGGADEPPWPEDQIRAAARQLKPARKNWDYRHQRPELLQLLLREAIDPAEFSQACDDDPKDHYRQLAAFVANDVALRAVWLAGSIWQG